MAKTLEELQTMRDTLLEQIASGARRDKFGERETEYQPTSDQMKALALLDAQIATTQGTRIRRRLVVTSKAL